MDKNGNIAETYNYDAWGRRRNPETWTYNNVPEPQLTRVGYTGHEHWDELGLINMTGRMYDPRLARFLSPDPYVQMPDNTQNLNRYSYCLNNPLIYTDPSGEFWHLVAGAVIGGTINWALNGAEFNREGLGYFAIGAVAGALGAGVGVGIQTASAGASFWAGFVGSSQGISTILGAAYSSSFINGALAGAGSGFASGFGTGFCNGLMQGQSFGTALGRGLEAGGWGALSGGIIGGTSGGIGAAKDGRDFFTGKYDYFEQVIDGNTYYFYSDESEVANKALQLSNSNNGNEVATYEVKESFLKRYHVVLDPSGNSPTSSNNFILNYDGTPYIGSSRFEMLSQKHFDYNPQGQIGIGSRADADFAKIHNVPVTHVSYNNGFSTYFRPNQWTQSNYDNFMGSSATGSGTLGFFKKVINKNAIYLW